MTVPIPTRKPQKMDALSLLSGPMGGGGMPSLSGGDAGPSNAFAGSGNNDIGFNSSFSVAGSGATSTAQSSPTRSNQNASDWLLIGGAVLMVFLITRSRK